ncbi:MAG: Fe-S cluster assembly protein SufD [Verrucomicrobia bacterium]|nr:Fe-S cluster assembly protein SufD [Verrucomicrobiota bacterium]
MLLETQSFLSSINESSDQLKKIRTKCSTRLQEVEFTDEAFEYLQLKELLSCALQKAPVSSVSKEALLEHVFPECEKSYVTFVNGQFRADLSDCASLPKGSFCISLEQAMKVFGTFVHNTFTKTCKEERDYFALFNAAFHQEGAFLYIPPKTVCTAPIQILSVIDTAERDSWMMPRLHLFAGAQSEASVAYRTVCLRGERYFYNNLFDIAIEDGAKVTASVDDLGLPPSESWLFDAFRVALKPNATFKGCQLAGSEKSRRDWNIAINGSNVNVELSGLWLLDGKKEAHVNVVMDHQEPYSRSLQLFKGVLNDAARSGFQGKIVVGKRATKTESYQINKNLMLSDLAEANSKPNLEIMTSDVKASHGATIGQLDERQLFYLKSRGFNEHEAKRCMINGFCHEIVEKLFLDSQARHFAEVLLQYVRI